MAELDFSKLTNLVSQLQAKEQTGYEIPPEPSEPKETITKVLEDDELYRFKFESWSLDTVSKVPMLARRITEDLVERGVVIMIGYGYELHNNELVITEPERDDDGKVIGGEADMLFIGHITMRACCTEHALTIVMSTLFNLHDSHACHTVNFADDFKIGEKNSRFIPKGDNQRMKEQVAEIMSFMKDLFSINDEDDDNSSKDT